MALSDLWKGFTRDRPVDPKPITLQDILDNYDLEYVSDEPGNQFAVISPRAGRPLPGEMGTSSASPFTSWVREEYNAKLRGLQGLETYDKMRRSDGGVRSTLRAVKTPVLAARWFVATEGDRAVDKQAAEWVQWNLFNEMSTSWAQTLFEAMLMLDFGYYMFEKVWENRVVRMPGRPAQMRTVLKKLGPRHPMDVKEWKFDVNGGPASVTMYGTNADIASPDIVIPIEKLLVFSFDKEAGNIQGISVLRSAFKHWYYKEQLYKIDAIQKERHGIGIPVIQLPPGYSAQDKAAAEALGRNIRTNERAHIVLPPLWEIKMLKLEGQPVDCMKSVAHHDSMIRQNILGEFLNGDGKEEDQTMFLKATRFTADIVCDVVNTYLIPQMVAYNYPQAVMPKLKARRIGEQEDQRTISFAVRNLIGAGAIIPDEPLEAVLREMMDLPPADPETARPQVTPQNANQEDPDEVEEDQDESDNDEEDNEGRNDSVRARGARVGPPRQALVRNQRNARGLPARNAGTDRGGR